MSLEVLFGDTDQVIMAGDIGNGVPMHDVCIPHRIPRALEQQE